MSRQFKPHPVYQKSTLYLVLALLLLPLLIPAQTPYTPTQAKTQFVSIAKIYDYPAEKCLPNTQSAWLGTHLEAEQTITLLYLQESDSTYFATHTLEIPSTTYVCELPECAYDFGSIRAECRWMKGIMSGVLLSEVDHQLKFELEIHYDLNEEDWSAAEEAEKNNDPLAYCHAYMGMQYYMDIDYRMLETLAWADSLALKLYRNKEYEQAAKLMLSLETDCDMTTLPSTEELHSESFWSAWSNASLYYLKAGFWEECVQLCQWMTERSPDLTGVYLQYGDALYNLERKAESRDKYTTYKTQMTQAGKAAQIPSRVTDRLSEK